MENIKIVLLFADDAVMIEKGTFSWDPEMGPCLKE